MRFSGEEIRKMIMEEKERIFDTGEDLTDFATEMTDGLLPIYYHEIISDWQHMPIEFDESGRDLCNSESTITDRMTADLFCYYRELVETELTECLNQWEVERL